MSKYYYSVRENADIYSIHLSPKVILGLLEVLTIIIAISCWRQLYNFIIYANKKFTKDDALINFVTEIQPNFKNAYSLNYQQQDRLIPLETDRLELATEEYKHSIDKTILISKTYELFTSYIKDRIKKNFSSIRKYTLEPFSFQQNHFDLVYSCRIFKIIPIKFEIREELKRFVMQINGEMINFKVSSRGYILSGQPEPRLFTEYWDIALDIDNKCYIVTIY